MKRPSIDFRLFPDIVFQGNIYSHYDEDSQRMLESASIPFLQAYKIAKDDMNILLMGEGSLGKSTSLRVFEAEMLYQNRPCLFYECKSINANDISRIETIAKKRKVEILIFDAYDELHESIRESFNHLLDKLNQYKIQIILSSRVSMRIDPRAGYAMEAIDNMFESYQTMYICDFTDEQLDSLVSKTISRSSGYYALLKNTMFLSLHLDLEKNDLLFALKDSVKTEAEFIQQYFELLYLDKLSDEVLLSDLIYLGKYVHNQREWTNHPEKRRKRVNRHKVRIPAPLKHIFEYTKERGDEKDFIVNLTSNQIKYLNYLHALYLKDCLLAMHDYMEDEELIQCLPKLLNMPSTSEISESVYYAGQLLANDEEAKRILIALNHPESKKKIRYENILCLFLGYNDDVAEDIPEIFEFYHPVMEGDRYAYLHVCDRIRELKANSIKNIEFGYSGFAQLEAIDVHNDFFYSKGNCLIKRSKNNAYDGLYLGCQNSEIPDGVVYIHSRAFSYCDIKRVVIPPSVRELDYLAFKNCEMLEYVELGEGVKRVERDAFYKCSAIKTVCIKNNYMQIGHEAYDLRAFEYVPKLERAIVPTTGISYVYKIAPDSLKYLDVTQGKTDTALVPFSFDDVEQTNHFKELIIRRDVEYFAEDAFILFKNNLERIFVEAECKAYSSVGNCLISNHEKAIVLGCKNSVIPERGIKRIKSFAFARCDIRFVNITADIESIGDKAFYKCYSLDTVRVAKALKFLGVDVFSHCFALKNVMIESVDQWSQIFFSTVLSNPLFFAKSLQCDELADKVLHLSDGIPLITSGAFKDCRDIEQVVIPPSVKEIRGCAFLYCNHIQEVHIKDIASWSSVQFNSFSANPLYQGARLFVDGCEAHEIVFEKNTVIRKHSLIRTQSIETIVLSEGCKVEYEAFKECPNLRRIVLHSTNIKINSSAFRGCHAALVLGGIEAEWKRMLNMNQLEGVECVVFERDQDTYCSTI